MNSPHVLLIDDDPDVYTIVRKSINPLVQLDHASNLEQALNSLKANKYSLVLLDIHLGEQNSVDFLETDEAQSLLDMRKIILFTQEKEIDTQVKCHDMGVRDYLHKPLNKKLLRSILDKHLAQILKSPQDVIQEGPLLINLMTQEVFIRESKENKRIHLTNKEFQILKILASHVGHVHSRESIFEKVWNEESNAMSRTVDMHISSLKKKLSPYSHMIKNKRSVGYLLEPHKDS